ncbi:MAG: RlmE family RNA methyltransferase [Candidatus Methanomethyliaceae archaeon]|nr:RlmE family RNA methyltransferase [Candidatus Methanomethyliaceae archaeon]
MPNKHKILGDFYYKEAKRAGFRSRSALKLKEIAVNYGLIRRGDYVADLGAAPGGWLQVEREFVGDQGLVVGVDLSIIKPLPFENVKLIKGDISDSAVLEELRRVSGRQIDVVVSDLAPKFSGVHDLDHVRQIALARIALASASKILKKGGRMVIKVLMGSEFNAFLKDTEKSFTHVKVFKPKASRESSSEIYLICKGYISSDK